MSAARSNNLLLTRKYMCTTLTCFFQDMIFIKLDPIGKVLMFIKASHM